MNTFLAVAVSFVFVVLALWHFYMALMPSSGKSGAVPSVGGKALFVPSTKATLSVGIVLLSFAALVVATSGIFPLPVPQLVFSWLSYGLALGLLARAIGEFKHVGFFKRNRGSRFATLDTFVYSPLCLALSAGVAAVAAQNGV